MQDFRKLRVWHAANAFTIAIYKATRSFPSDERFGLTSHLRRAAVSIQANIAEGSGRGSRADTARFLQYAIGSAAEASNFLSLSRDLGYLPQDVFVQLDEQSECVRRTLIRLLFRLRPYILAAKKRDVR